MYATKSSFVASKCFEQIKFLGPYAPRIVLELEIDSQLELVTQVPENKEIIYGKKKTKIAFLGVLYFA